MSRREERRVTHGMAYSGQWSKKCSQVSGLSPQAQRSCSGPKCALYSPRSQAPVRSRMRRVNWWCEREE